MLVERNVKTRLNFYQK